MKRGEIYFADLGMTKGSEQGKIRPVLIIQNNHGNTHFKSTIVACITAYPKVTHLLPTQYLIPSSIGMQEGSIVMCEQIRTIDSSNRLLKKIGKLNAKQMQIINRKLCISLDIPKSEMNITRRVQ